MLYLTSLEKIVFHWLKTTIPAGRVVGWSGGRVRWLDNLEMLINSVQLSWSLTELAYLSCYRLNWDQTLKSRKRQGQGRVTAVSRHGKGKVKAR